VADAGGAVRGAEDALAEQDEALGLLGGLAAMGDGDAFPGWDPLYTKLGKAMNLSDKALDRLFDKEDTDGPFLARHARKVLATGGDPGEIAALVADYWRQGRADLESKARELRKAHQALLRRYRAALERRRRANGLPGPDDLDRVQRYEAHLERGLHKALDRLRDLRVGRGAAPPGGPSVAVAVVQTRHGGPAEALVGPFGSFAHEGMIPAQDGAGQVTKG
jgi:hypothetical protein